MQRGGKLKVSLMQWIKSSIFKVEPEVSLMQWIKSSIFKVGPTLSHHLLKVIRNLQNSRHRFSSMNILREIDH